jgi:hypothetical protein
MRKEWKFSPDMAVREVVVKLVEGLMGWERNRWKKKKLY